MAISAEASAPKQAATVLEPLLEPGDRLTRDEFERRYQRMPNLKKAELIEGIVYMPSPLRYEQHAKPHTMLGTWLGTYISETLGVEGGDNATVRLDLDNEPQPDLVLFKSPQKGGKVRISQDDYIEGAPELAVEIVGSSTAYDLNQKKDAYRRNGVREYLAWITNERRVIWWELKMGEYKAIPSEASALLKSNEFPGLWLDAKALLRGDLKSVLSGLKRGLRTREHRAICDSVRLDPVQFTSNFLSERVRKCSRRRRRRNRARVWPENPPANERLDKLLISSHFGSGV